MVTRTAKLILPLILLGVILFSGALGCSKVSNPPTVSTDENRASASDSVYSGVLSDSDGNPLAWVSVYLDGELAGETGEDGSFTIYGVEDGAEYALEARLDGEVVYSTTLSPSDRTAQVIGDNDPDFPRGTVWGFVKDQLGPVPHALVIIFNASENFGVDFTDEKGYYEIVDAPAGPGVAIAFAPKHAVGKEKVFVIEGGEVQNDLFLPMKLDFGIVGGVVVTGPPENVIPVPGAMVGLKPNNAPPDAPPIIAITNKFGAFVMPKVPLGPAMITAGAPCFNQDTHPIDVLPGKNQANFHIAHAPCGGIEGMVTDTDGVPIPKTNVVASQILPDGKIVNIPGFSDEFGFYKIEPLMPGPYNLDAKHPGFKPWHFNGQVKVFPDQFAVVDITMTPIDGGG